MIDLYFLTTSRIKFDHIQYLLKEYEINIKPPIDYGKPYTEPRIYDREKLLLESIIDANRRMGRLKISNKTKKSLSNSHITNSDSIANEYQDKLFIIEDTSVIIDALSTDEELPGVDIKYWMKEIDFQKLDAQLKQLGDNRSVSVRSDIVMYIPKRYRNQDNDVFYKIFTGVTRGTVVEKEFNFDTNLMYPWLDNRTFNKWFVPLGCDKPISMLSIKEATKHDFRRKSIGKLVDYFKDINLLNISNNAIQYDAYQEQLFGEQYIILCGPSCGGKSLLALHLAKKYGFYHIEASDFMHLAFYKKHGTDSDISIHDFASNALTEDPHIVTREVEAHIDILNNIPVIITGFRSPEELSVFFKDNKPYKYYYVEAVQKIRYERCLKRNRHDTALTYNKFKERDDLQNKMGLSKIKKLSNFRIIENNTTMKQYFKNFHKHYITHNLSHQSVKLNAFLNKTNISLTLEQSILIALLFDAYKNHEFHTTTEISKLINRDLAYMRSRNGKTFDTDKNNVSRYFNQKYYPFYELKRINKQKNYRLTTTGISQALYYINTLPYQN